MRHNSSVFSKASPHFPPSSSSVGETILLVDTVNKALRHDEQCLGSMTSLSLTHPTHRRRDLFQGSKATFDGSIAWIVIGLGDLVFPWLPPNSNSWWKVKEGKPSSSLGLGCSPKQSDWCGRHSLAKPLGGPHRTSTSYWLHEAWQNEIFSMMCLFKSPSRIHSSLFSRDEAIY